MIPVGIVGVRAIRDPDAPTRLEELVFETAAGALADAGIGRDRLESVVLATSDELDGRSISSMLTAAPAGALLKDEVKVTDSGLHGLLLGVMRIQSGLFDVGLVVSWSMSSQAYVPAVQQTALEPFVERPVGAVDPIATGLVAHAYLALHGYGVTDLDARAQVKRREAGRPPAPGDGEYVAYPLKRCHLAPLVDGAAAAVTVSARALERFSFRHDPIWITGMGWATGAYSLARRRMPGWPALTAAAAQAFGRAGLGPGDVDFFELDDYAVIHEALALEALGVVPAGRGLAALLTGAVPPVNPVEGGGFSGYPLYCAGLYRLVRAVERMRGDPGLDHGLVHGTTGIAAQGHAVVILSRRYPGERDG